MAYKLHLGKCPLYCLVFPNQSDLFQTQFYIQALHLLNKLSAINVSHIILKQFERHISERDPEEMLQAMEAEVTQLFPVLNHI